MKPNPLPKVDEGYYLKMKQGLHKLASYIRLVKADTSTDYLLKIKKALEGP